MEGFPIFTALRAPAELRTVTRAHVIAWRKALESRNLMPASILRRLSPLSSLFDYLCERNAVAGDSVDGVKRPMAMKAVLPPWAMRRRAACRRPLPRTR